MKQDIGVIGLGVMGKSISRNLAQKGFKLSMYNRHVLGTEEKVAERFKATHLELNNAGLSVSYSYDTQSSQTGITSLLQDIKETGLRLRDIKTEQSSLENIFVELVQKDEK